MLVTISKQEGHVPFTVMHLHGDLDASNYTEVIRKAQELYESGARDLLIDLSKVPYISSAGLMSLHTAALIFAGESVQINKSGRPAFRALDTHRDLAVRKHVKLLGPQPQVDQLLEIVGLKQFFQIFDDPENAGQSF
jgi:anti-anti-sigma factor